MRENMKTGDIILQAPPKGNGASLQIKYFLLRQKINITCSSCSLLPAFSIGSDPPGSIG
jgi:hypothetical protein